MEEPSKSTLSLGMEEPSKSVLEEEMTEEINGEVGFEEVSELNVKIGEPSEQIRSSLVSPRVSVEANELDGDGTGANCESLPPESGSSVPAAKGYGLKKWRRIMRGSNSGSSPIKSPSPSNYSSPGADSSVIYKRRLSIHEPRKPKNDVVEVAVGPPVPSVGSLDPVEADPDLVHLATSFSIGMDSDNSEERSSKSSTAASGPKPRHEIGFGRERGRLKKGRGGGVDAGKKFRGDRIKLGKETSQLSVESTKFTRRRSGVSSALNLDGEHSDEAQMYGEVRSGYYKENGEDFDADLLEKENSGKSEKFRPLSGIDPFVESIVLLQTAQEALETEIQKIGEIRKEASVEFEETELCSVSSSEANLLELTQEKELLQRKLDEALATVKAKESKILELKDIIERTQFVKRETRSTRPPLLDEMHRTLEFELESLLRDKIEAEIEFLIMTRTTQSWKVLTEDQIALFESQKPLGGNHAQMALKLKEAENKVTKLMERADELDACCEALLHTTKTLKMKSKVSKVFRCFCIQLILLCFAVGLFLIQMLPQSHDIVPT